MGTLHEDLSTW